MAESNSTSSARRGGDPLLTVVWWLLTALLVLCLFLAVLGLLAYPIMLLNHAYVVRSLAQSGIQPSALPWIGVLGVLLAVAMALTYLFLLHLRKIVDSVAHGRPFDPINAERLRWMAWLSLAIQIAGVPMTRLIFWFDAMPHKPNVHHNDHGISLGGIVLTLTLFVLARVFRTGAKMQEDLEGTV